MHWWIEWYYNAANLLEGKIVTAASQPQVNNASNIVAVTGPYASSSAAQAKLASMAGQTAPSNLQAAGEAAGLGAGFLGNLLGLPHFTSAELRAFALRGLKIITGLVLIIVGLAQLTHLQQNLPKAVPVPV